MVSCKGCGAEVDARKTDCPYCGHSLLQSVRNERISMTVEDTYVTRQDEDGLTHIQFGDGRTGARPTSGKGISATYRRGAGSYSLFVGQQMEENWEQLDTHLEMVPTTAGKNGSISLGQVLLESMSIMGNLLSFYQKQVADEVHLSTDDRERLSKAESKVRPKLRGLVSFCDTADKKTQKELGLAESDVQRLKKSAITILGMIDIGFNRCSNCGTENKSGSRKCSNCGTSLV